MTNESEWKRLCELVENERDLDKLSKYLNQFVKLLIARKEALLTAGPPQAESHASGNGRFDVNHGKHETSPHRR